jgi:23S rRNA-/tRNA-specific pseudouridylate synthase
VGTPFGNPSLVARVGELWVLSKPSGFATHPTGEGVPDLMTWAVAHLRAPAGLAPIHRLDRETSGVVLCAGNPKVLARYGQFFERGQAVKRYRALVHGRAHVKGVIRRPLKEGQGMLEAITRYRKLAWYGPTTYLEARPETGRRHQIRRHLQGIGHAVVGDERYPPKRFRKVAGFPGRLWLHAYCVELPGGLRYEAPLPPELAQHLALLAEMGE